MAGKNLFKSGFSLVEAIVGVAIITITIGSLVVTYNFYTKAGLGAAGGIQAGYLLEEGAEVLAFWRDAGWTANIGSLAASSTYYFEWKNNDSWAATTSNRFIDGVFQRSFILENVKRDGNGNIVSTGGNPDAGTKKATISVAWFGRQGTTTKSVSTYITNLFGN
jgi:hypothetical protein